MNNREQMERMALAMEKIERRGRFSWGRVAALLAVIIVITILIL